MLDILNKINLAEEARSTYYQAFKTDPLARFLINKLHLSPLKAYLLGLAIVVFYDGLALVMKYIGLNPAGFNLPVLDIAYDLVFIPAVFYFYIWTSATPQEVFLRLEFEGLKVDGYRDMNEFAKRATSSFIHHYFWPLISIILTSLWFLYTEYGSFLYSHVWGTPDANFWLFRIIKIPILWALPIYMVIVIYGKQMMMALRVRRMLGSKKKEAQKIKADRINSIISGYFSRFAHFVGACGVGFVLLLYRASVLGYTHIDFVVPSAMVSYLSLCAFFLFYPLQPLSALTRLTDGIPDLRLKNFTFGVPSQAFATFVVVAILPGVLWTGIRLMMR